MRIVCISDTHNKLELVDVPDGDVLLHAGDLTAAGTAQEVFQEYEALSRLPHEHIVAIPGNHDFPFQQIPELRQILEARFPRVTTLIDEELMLDGIRLYGSPWQPWWQDWAYQFPEHDVNHKQASETWSLIPEDTVVLLTHGPPRGVLDCSVFEEHVGCPALRDRIAKLPKLGLHVFGHAHSGYGVERAGATLFVNASACDTTFLPTQRPVIVDYVDGAFEHRIIL